ncbi:MAG: hypothetical protein JW839_14365, partial [Candidatus Lokiarchaeota archaeon]|nr:hypothetical protein [Candidatus Lokiarchaeota archaeon]
ELTGQFAERVDPALIDMYQASLDRQREMASRMGGFFGGMMGMATKMAQGMQTQLIQQMRLMQEYPPLVMVLKCMNCHAALDLSLPVNRGGS